MTSSVQRYHVMTRRKEGAGRMPARSMRESHFVDPIEYELSKERAGSLGRYGRKLEAAVREYRELESASRAEACEEKLWELAELTMGLLVTREACGLRNADSVLRFYDVPREAVMRMGVRRPARSG